MENETRNILLALILVAIVGIGGFFIWHTIKNSSSEKNLKGESSVVSQNETAQNFSKKQECEQYSEGIKNELRSRDFTVQKTGYTMNHYLNEIFYSPVADSCLYVYEQTTSKDFKIDAKIPCLVDVLSKETLLCEAVFTDEMRTPIELQKEQDFQKRVDAYKEIAR